MNMNLPLFEQLSETGILRRDRVVYVTAPGLTSQNTPDGQKASFKNTMDFERLHRILRTGRHMTAAVWEQRGNEIPVKPDR